MQMMIKFEKCVGTTDDGQVCHTEEEIMEHIRRKFIAIVYNQARFDQEGYFEESIVKESRIAYIPINSQVREQNNFQVS